MDTKIEGGGFILDSRGIPKTVEGLEELLQRIKFVLTIEKGSYRYDRELGSRLREVDLSYEHVQERLVLTANEALLNFSGVEIKSAEIQEGYISFFANTYLGSGEIRVVLQNAEV